MRQKIVRVSKKWSKEGRKEKGRKEKGRKEKGRKEGRKGRGGKEGRKERQNEVVEVKGEGEGEREVEARAVGGILSNMIRLAMATRNDDLSPSEKNGFFVKEEIG